MLLRTNALAYFRLLHLDAAEDERQQGQQQDGQEGEVAERWRGTVSPGV